MFGLKEKGSQMSESYLPWLSGAFALIGALIGTAGSVMIIYFQTKIQDRRALLRHAAEMCGLQAAHGAGSARN
jgi:hypothetical protein